MLFQTHTVSRPKQHAGLPPCFRHSTAPPSQGATEVRECDLKSSSKAAHPCCLSFVEQELYCFFPSAPSLPGSRTSWWVVRTTLLLLDMLCCLRYCDERVQTACQTKSSVHSANICCLALEAACCQVVTKQSWTLVAFSTDFMPPVSVAGIFSSFVC